jgi:hypothetical protein
MSLLGLALLKYSLQTTMWEFVSSRSNSTANDDIFCLSPSICQMYQKSFFHDVLSKRKKLLTDVSSPAFSLN